MGCIWTRCGCAPFPFTDAVADFINAHDQVFLVEQNRDAQMRMLLVNECGIDPARFISVLHFDGTPITARFISEAIAERMTHSSPRRPRNDLYRQTQAAPSRAFPVNKLGFTHRDYEGVDLDAVRRLRP